MDKVVIIIIIDEITLVTNHIMTMVLVIIVALEEIMEVVNRVAEIQRIMGIRENECKPIRSTINICGKYE